MSTIRIVVLGDFHLHDDAIQLTHDAMEDIKRVDPDLVVPLGDFGGSGRIGGPEGLEEAHALLQRTGAPVRPILGNHDLQRESGYRPEEARQPIGTIQRRLCQLFQLERPYGVDEHDDFRFLYISAEPLPPEICYHRQEMDVTEEQFSFIEETLTNRPDVPVLVFSHAPPPGTGLRTVPHTHVRATNAYMGQNGDALRWRRLYRDHPQLVAWFSAHYHLGHGHPDSLTNRFGTYFFMTAIHGRATRDGSRQSRVMDIDGEGITVRTLDHRLRELTDEGLWRHTGSPRQLVRRRIIQGLEFQQGSLHGVGMEEAPLRLAPQAPSQVGQMNLGMAPVIPGGLAWLPGGSLAAATRAGFLWEVEPALESLRGAYHVDEELAAVAASGRFVWRAWEQQLARIEVEDIMRFRRYKGHDPAGEVLKLEGEVVSLAAAPDRGVWVLLPGRILRISPNMETAETVQDLPADNGTESGRLVSSGPRLFLLTGDGQLWRRDHAANSFERLAAGVLAWDQGPEHAAMIQHRDDGYYVVSTPLSGDGHPVEVRLPDPLDLEMDEASAAVMALRGGAVAAVIGQRAYWWQPGSAVQKLAAGAPVVAAARAPQGTRLQEPDASETGDEGSSVSFALAHAPRAEGERPQLTLWNHAAEGERPSAAYRVVLEGRRPEVTVRYRKGQPAKPVAGQVVETEPGSWRVGLTWPQDRLQDGSGVTAIEVYAQE